MQKTAKKSFTQSILLQKWLLRHGRWFQWWNKSGLPPNPKAESKTKMLGVNDTQIDSIQYLNFAKKWFNSIFNSISFHKKLGSYWVPISKLGGPYKFMWQWKRQKGPYMDPVPIIGTLWVTVAMLSGAGHCRANVVIFLQEVCYAGSILYITGPGAGVNIFFSGWHQ